ncbi:hypothetical protein Nham_4240 (plasmid) [Nitrobacter hamburgensis X14]|uniref:Uncharacterized protein n=1 Tax=Nitrobacter hamburgensis (strain DSM 10229 / NCIMB 13809 / X14) TaxID=323097 RepID=Q1QFZ4_NITHX|nr:hypothetical protein Nham_4240 [Nitrobacter hamburgensis X14]
MRPARLACFLEVSSQSKLLWSAALGWSAFPSPLASIKLRSEAVQLSALALRLSAKNFRSAMAEHPRLRELLLKYALFRLIVEAQAAVWFLSGAFPRRQHPMRQ